MIRTVYISDFPDGQLVLTIADMGAARGEGHGHLASYAFRHGGQLLFCGCDYCPGASKPVCGNESIAGLLGFLALKPGDTDAEYFENYNKAQEEWAETYAEDLGLIVYEYESQRDSEQAPAVPWKG